eukprot:GILJ01005703.1.p1 GENE.GILJ01005703.1~~GILJ01005703.1.p1  ORF type:complete len:328 (-),score=12.15 GILJ01005703.1:393-1274(-)
MTAIAVLFFVVSIPTATCHPSCFACVRHHMVWCEKPVGSSENGTCLSRHNATRCVAPYSPITNRSECAGDEVDPTPIDQCDQCLADGFKWCVAKGAQVVDQDNFCTYADSNCTKTFTPIEDRSQCSAALNDDCEDCMMRTNVHFCANFRPNGWNSVALGVCLSNDLPCNSSYQSIENLAYCRGSLVSNESVKCMVALSVVFVATVCGLMFWKYWVMDRRKHHGPTAHATDHYRLVDDSNQSPPCSPPSSPQLSPMDVNSDRHYALRSLNGRYGSGLKKPLGLYETRVQAFPSL